MDMFNLNYCVYQISFPNGKLYVGATNDFERRKAEHLKLAEDPHLPLHFAIKSFGPDKIKWTILNKNLSAYQAQSYERMHIQRLNQFGDVCLNNHSGGNGLTTFSEPVKQHRLNHQIVHELMLKNQGNK